MSLGLPPDWYQRAQDAISVYDQLVKEASLLGDEDARGKIFEFIGRTDMPSDPAERYVRVVADLKRAEATTPPDYTVFTDDLVKERITQLEAINETLQPMLAEAIGKYGSFGSPNGEPSQPGQRIAAGILTGSIALLGLVILPLALGR